MTGIRMSIYPHLARGFINLLGAVVDEFMLTISKEGWTVRAVDPANIVMININLPKDNFINYEFEESGNWTSSIDGHPTGVMDDNLDVEMNVSEIKDFMGGLNNDEPVLAEELYSPIEFTFSKAPEKYSNRYQLELKQGMFRREMILLNEKEIRRKPTGNVVFPSDYKLLINSFVLTRIIKKAQKVSDYIRFGFKYDETERSMQFIASTEDDKDMPWEAVTTPELWERMCDKPRNESSSMFSLDYMDLIIKTIPQETVWLCLGQDYPCQILFKLGMAGQCEYLQAPRIESE